jgi:hypothetical protein
VSCAQCNAAVGGNSIYFNRARSGQSWVCEANLGNPLRKKILGMPREQFQYGATGDVSKQVESVKHLR